MMFVKQHGLGGPTYLHKINDDDDDDDGDDDYRNDDSNKNNIGDNKIYN